MQTRPLGRSLQTAPIMLGGNVFGWTADKAASFALLDAFIEAGFNAVDTADAYSRWVPGHQGGESETVIGQYLAARGTRHRWTIATKLGLDLGPGQGGLSRRWITQAVELSLKRLQTDYIDLYQAHRDDPATPMEETLGAFADLMKAGKIRSIGASNFTAARLRQALDTSARCNLPAYETLQPLYNLMERPAFEADLQPVCVSENISVIPYYSLASGFLTGKYRSEADLGQSPRGAGVKKYLDSRGFSVLAALDRVAARHRATPAQAALAWVIAQPAIAAPIASATSVAQLHDILGAAALSLTPDDLALLANASAQRANPA